MTGLAFTMFTRPLILLTQTAKKANYVLQTYWRDMTSGFEFGLFQDIEVELFDKQVFRKFFCLDILL